MRQQTAKKYQMQIISKSIWRRRIPKLYKTAPKQKAHKSHHNTKILKMYPEICSFVGKSSSRASSCIEITELRKLDSLLNQCESISCDNLLLYDEIYNYELCLHHKRKYYSTTAINKVPPKNSIKRKTHKKLLGIRESDKKIIKLIGDKQGKVVDSDDNNNCSLPVESVGCGKFMTRSCSNINQTVHLGDDMLLQSDFDLSMSERILTRDGKIQQQLENCKDDERWKKVYGGFWCRTLLGPQLHLILIFYLHFIFNSIKYIISKGNSALRIKFSNKAFLFIVFKYFSIKKVSTISAFQKALQTNKINKSLIALKSAITRSTVIKINAIKRSPEHLNIFLVQKSLDRPSRRTCSKPATKHKKAAKRKQCSCRNYDNINFICETSLTIPRKTPAKRLILQKESSGERKFNRLIKQQHTEDEDSEAYCENRMININDKSIEVTYISIDSSISLMGPTGDQEKSETQSLKSKRSKFSPSFISRKLNTTSKTSEDDNAGGAKELLLGLNSLVEKKLPDPVDTVCKYIKCLFCFLLNFLFTLRLFPFCNRGVACRWELFYLNEQRFYTKFRKLPLLIFSLTCAKWLISFIQFILFH